jgi:hypothetical protein
VDGEFRPRFVSYFIRVQGKIQASTSFGDDGHVELACELKGLESFQCALYNKRRQILVNVTRGTIRSPEE